MGEQTQQAQPGLMNRLATVIVDRRRIILTVTLILVAVSLVSRNWVTVENELSAYLPDDSSTKHALDLMDEEFTTFGSARVMVENVTLAEAQALSDELEALDGVQSVSFDNTADHYKNASALYNITFDYDEDDDACLDALEQVKETLSGYDSYLTTDLGDQLAEIIDSEVSVIMVYVAIIVVLVLTFTSQTYAEVPVLLLTFLTAMLLNSGCNFLLGTISFVSNSVTNILQLALSLDYAIILSNHFKEEYETQPLREAVISALSKAIVEISASSLTTIGGLAAMMFMKFKIGPDMGICLIKAILFAMLSVFFVMPGLLMVFGPWMEKTRHKNFVPKIPFVGKFAYATRHVVPALFAVVLVGACILSQKCPYAYGDDTVETPTKNEVQLAEEKINETFGQRNLVAVVLPAGDYKKEQELLQALSSYDEVDEVVGLANTEVKNGCRLTDSLTARELSQLLGLNYEASSALFTAYAAQNSDYGGLLENMEQYRVPLLDLLSFVFDEMDKNGFDLDALGVEIEKDDGSTVTLGELRTTLDNAKCQLQSDDYSRILVYLNLPESGDETYAFLDTIEELAQSEYPGEDIYLAGNSTTDYDFKKTFSVDNTVVSLVSIGIVLVVLLFTFLSAGMSVLLILVIQGSIWINFSIPYLQNRPLFFMSYLVVSSIQMGANIDYAIVISSRYQELKNKMPHKQAIIETMNFAFPTILTSGTILAVAGTLIGRMTSEVAIVGIGQSLGRGTIISMILVMFVLPQILLVGNKLVDKTTFSLPKHTSKRVEADGKVQIDGHVRGEVRGAIDGHVQGTLTGDMNLTVLSGTASEEG